MKISTRNISVPEFSNTYSHPWVESSPPASTLANRGMSRPDRSSNGQFYIAPALRPNGDKSLELDPAYFEDLYERATGEPPHEVLALESGVLIETSVVGSYDHCPNGYLPLLLTPTPSGWIVFDTGHSAPKAQPIPDGVRRDGDILYLETGTLDELQDGIATMVRLLGELNQG